MGTHYREESIQIVLNSTVDEEKETHLEDDEFEDDHSASIEGKARF